MRLPIKTADVVALCAALPVSVTEHGTDTVKLDAATGLPLSQVLFIALFESGPETISAKVPGNPTDLVVGQPVNVTDLVATTWAMGDRSGVSFRAASITPANAAAIRRSES
jgi:hypothetical protein